MNKLSLQRPEGQGFTVTSLFHRSEGEKGFWFLYLYVTVLIMVVRESKVYTPLLSRVPVSLYFYQTRLPISSPEGISTIRRGVRKITVRTPFKGD